MKNKMKMSQITPKLPYINREETKEYYKKLGFDVVKEFDQYFIMAKNDAGIHFFEFPNIDPKTTNFMIYLNADESINSYYQTLQEERELNTEKQNLESLQEIAFSVVDPNGTLLTFQK